MAVDIAPLVQRLADTGGAVAVPGAAPGAGGTSVVADGRSNSLIVRAPNAARMAVVRATIAKLDRPSTAIGPGGGLWVVHLKNADAVKLATVLRAAFAGTGGTGGSSGGASTGVASALQTQQTSPNIGASRSDGGTAAGASPQATAPVTASGQPTTGGFIQADPATNSLIITAPEPLYKQVRAMIDQLDSRRAQVYIESMIVEVSGGNEADFGFQWQGLLGKSGDSTGLIGGTNFGTTGNLVHDRRHRHRRRPGPGPERRRHPPLRRRLRAGGHRQPAAEPEQHQHRLDPEPDHAGQRRSQDRRRRERALHHRPVHQHRRHRDDEPVPDHRAQGRRHHAAHPAADRRRRHRAHDDLPGAEQRQRAEAGTSNAGPSTTKRSIESQVVVDDGQILVLGGLIEDRFIDDPAARCRCSATSPGWARCSAARAARSSRTNLMVFLRPIVMRDADSANSASRSTATTRSAAGRQAAQPAPSFVLPINEAPVLPPPVPAPAPARRWRRSRSRRRRAPRSAPSRAP